MGGKTPPNHPLKNRGVSIKNPSILEGFSSIFWKYPHGEPQKDSCTSCASKGCFEGVGIPLGHIHTAYYTGGVPPWNFEMGKP